MKLHISVELESHEAQAFASLLDVLRQLAAAAGAPPPQITTHDVLQQTPVSSATGVPSAAQSAYSQPPMAAVASHAAATHGAVNRPTSQVSHVPSTTSVANGPAVAGRHGIFLDPLPEERIPIDDGIRTYLHQLIKGEFQPEQLLEWTNYWVDTPAMLLTFVMSFIGVAREQVTAQLNATPTPQLPDLEVMCSLFAPLDTAHREALKLSPGAKGMSPEQQVSVKLQNIGFLPQILRLGQRVRADDALGRAEASAHAELAARLVHYDIIKLEKLFKMYTSLLSRPELYLNALLGVLFLFLRNQAEVPTMLQNSPSESAEFVAAFNALPDHSKLACESEYNFISFWIQGLQMPPGWVAPATT